MTQYVRFDVRPREDHAAFAPSLEHARELIAPLFPHFLATFGPQRVMLADGLTVDAGFNAPMGSLIFQMELDVDGKPPTDHPAMKLLGAMSAAGWFVEQVNDRGRRPFTAPPATFEEVRRSNLLERLPAVRTDVPWSTLRDAMGSAAAVPSFLGAVLSDDPRLVDYGWGELQNRVIHQDTIYSCTGPVVGWMLARAAEQATPPRLRRRMMMFAQACVDGHHYATPRPIDPDDDYLRPDEKAVRAAVLAAGDALFALAQRDADARPYALTMASRVPKLWKRHDWASLARSAAPSVRAHVFYVMAHDAPPDVPALHAAAARGEIEEQVAALWLLAESRKIDAGEAKRLRDLARDERIARWLRGDFRTTGAELVGDLLR